MPSYVLTFNTRKNIMITLCYHNIEKDFRYWQDPSDLYVWFHGNKESFVIHRENYF